MGSLSVSDYLVQFRSTFHFCGKYDVAVGVLTSDLGNRYGDLIPIALASSAK